MNHVICCIWYAVYEMQEIWYLTMRWKNKICNISYAYNLRCNKIYIINWYFSNCNFVWYCIDSILENWWPENDKLSQNYILSVKERVVLTIYSYFPMMRISSVRFGCTAISPIGDKGCNRSIVVISIAVAGVKLLMDNPRKKQKSSKKIRRFECIKCIISCLNVIIRKAGSVFQNAN